MYDPEGLEGLPDDKWDLSSGTRCVRRKHPYWKFYADGEPEKVNQKYTRYSMETERRERIVSEDRSVNMILDETLIDGKEVTDTHIQKAEMENQLPPPSQDMSSLPDFPALEHSYCGGKIDVPSECTIVRTMDRSAYS
jgi:hypothetical protein